MPIAITAPLVIAVYGIVSIVSAGLALALAGMKRRDGQSWAFWSFLFPPVLLALLFSPKGSPEEHRDRKLTKALRRQSDDD